MVPYATYCLQILFGHKLTNIGTEILSSYPARAVFSRKFEGPYPTGHFVRCHCDFYVLGSASLADTTQDMWLVPKALCLRHRFLCHENGNANFLQTKISGLARVIFLICNTPERPSWYFTSCFGGAQLWWSPVYCPVLFSVLFGLPFSATEWIMHKVLQPEFWSGIERITGGRLCTALD